jgi:uncharacterized membrane protein HdeD (DUF308 family)
MSKNWEDVKKLLVPLVPAVAYKIAEKTNGWKTISGLILTGAGVGCLFVPALQSAGAGLLITGAPMLATGIIHKIIKFKNKKEEKSSAQQINRTNS